MKKIKKTVEVYEFKELEENIQDEVLNGIITRMTWLFSADALKKDIHDRIETAINECANNRTPWFEMQYIYDELKNEIEERANNFYYNENGGVEVEKKLAVYT